MSSGPRRRTMSRGRSTSRAATTDWYCGVAPIAQCRFRSTAAGRGRIAAHSPTAWILPIASRAGGNVCCAFTHRRRRCEAPNDFWSQSMCWGNAAVTGSKVRVRFRNDGGKAYARAEAHLIYHVKTSDATRVTFHWSDDGGSRQADHTFAVGEKETRWKVS